MILKVAAAGAAAYGLYRLIARRNEDSAKFRPAAGSRTPTASSVTPLGQGGPYVSPV